MVSATDFLPLTITWFMNFASVTLPNLGSGRTSRLATTRLLGMVLPFSLQVIPNTDLPLTRRRQGFSLTYIVKPVCADRTRLLGTLRTILGAAIPASGYPRGIEAATYGVITRLRSGHNPTTANPSHT